MGIWDTVGTIAKGAMNKVEAFNAEVLELVNEYEREDDEYLKRKVKNGTTTQKAAATKVLRGRGYFQQ